MIPEAAVEAATSALDEMRTDPARLLEYLSYEKVARITLKAALPHIQAQTLDEAVHAFPLETIHAPDNAVVWMMRRAQEIRGKI